MSANTCDICCEDFNKSNRHKIDCASCDINSCRKCVQTYLLTIKDQPHCMNCNNHWDLDVLIKSTTKSFVNGKYKQHKQDYLFEHEQSRLPDTMPAVEAYKHSVRLTDERADIQKQIDEASDIMNILKNRKNVINRTLHSYNRGTEPRIKVVFNKSCPVDNCRGFLSTAWKCGSCDTHTCSKCFTIKVEGIDHVCNEDDVKSAEVIKKDTRSCPGCATSIFKIDGCDQMWCTQCHTAFSYKTGAKIHGVIHNPHFYAWQNADGVGAAGGGGGGNIAPINVPGAVMCGGIPEYRALNIELCWNLNVRQSINTRRDCELDPLTAEEGAAVLSRHLHRHSRHFTYVVLEPQRLQCNVVNDNEKMRVQYILKDINEEQMKQGIMKADRKRGKAEAVLQIYELVNTVLIESVRDIFENLRIKREINDSTYGRESPVEVIRRNHSRCEALREYANNELMRVSVMYSQNIGYISETFNTVQMKYKSSELVN
jgi:hypothetical protein